MQRLAITLFWSAALFALVMATLRHPPDIPGGPGDKLQHIAAFVVLSVLGAWAYPRMRLASIFVGLALFGGLIELIQAMPALHRDADWHDWAADCSAAALALLIVFALRRARAPAAP